MKKFFLIPLLTLMCSVMAWGVEVGTFAELQEAIATPNAEITLTAIIDVTADLNLNGATITGYKMYLRVPSDASVVLENGTISNTYTALLSGSGSALYINNGGKVTLRNISLSAYAPVYFKTKGEVEIGTGVTFTSTAATTRKIFEYSGSTKDAHKITLLDGANLELNQVDQQIAMNNYYKFTINLGATLTLDGVVARKSATCNASIVNNGTLNIKKYFCVTTLDYSGNGDINISELTTGMRFSDAAFEALHVLDNLDNPSAYKFVKAATKISGVKTIVTDVRLATDEIADVFAEYTDATLGNVEIDKTETSKVSLDFADAVNLAGSNELRLIKYVPYKGTIDITGKDIVFANGGLTVENGSLTITGTGTIRSTNDANCLFQVNGKGTDAANYSTLTIGENVTIDGGYCAIGVFGTSNGANAYGVTVNMNGTLQNQKMAVTINGNVTATTGNVPVINLNGTINCYNVGAYAAGYGIWNVAGSITTTPAADRTKSSAFAAKSGQININDGAVLVGAGDGSRVEAFNNGVISSGAALQLESNGAYAGGMNITIADGATLRSNGGWYAIYEYVADGNDPTAVTSIAVNGGHFQGGILISQALAAKGGFVSGGKWSKDVSANIKAGENLSLLNNEDDDNPPYLYLVGVPTPAQEADYAEKDASNNAVLTNAASQSAAESYSSDNVGNDPDVIATKETNPVVVSENTDVVATEAAPIVEVKKVTVDNNAQLTVTEGATLMVGAGAVTLDENSSNGLTVEAGAALVVEGLVYGSTEENFVIKGEEDKSGIVLFSPETEFIREDHPKATYRFKSKSFKDGSKWVYQRFGMPSVDGNVSVKEADGTPSTVRSFICTWDYATDDWSSWAELDKTNGLVYTDAVPFQCYQLGSDNTKDAPVTYDFIVELMGNANAPLNFKAGWNPYANSYTAPIDIKEFLTDVIANNGSDILATIYLYKDLGNDTYTWQGINLSNVGKTYRVRENGAMVKKTYDASIEPMQAFIMKLSSGDDATTDINYLNNVYNPAMGIDRPASAPARSRASYSEMQIGAYNDMYWDNISVMEGEQFSAAEDNGYDAPKYDHNRGLSLYVINGEQHMERVATDNADGLFIGINAPLAGTYTLDFSGIVGMNYSIMDMTNNTIVTIEEDGQFNFYAEAGQNDYRFQLVAPARVPTAVENVGAKADVKGVYTITGQYLGEDINALPKGVYIINGAKVVK